MATRSEQFHSEEQRRAHGVKAPKPKRAQVQNSPDRPRATKGAGRKATHALEVSNSPRPSRKSTRTSANRARGDVALLHKQDIVKGSPEAKFEKSDARDETTLAAVEARRFEQAAPELPNAELVALAAVAPAFDRTSEER